MNPFDLRITQVAAEGEGKWKKNPEDETGYPGGLAQKMMDSIIIGSLKHRQGGVYLGHPQSYCIPCWLATRISGTRC